MLEVCSSHGAEAPDDQGSRVRRGARQFEDVGQWADCVGRERRHRRRDRGRDEIKAIHERRQALVERPRSVECLVVGMHCVIQGMPRGGTSCGVGQLYGEPRPRVGWEERAQRHRGEPADGLAPHDEGGVERRPDSLERLRVDPDHRVGYFVQGHAAGGQAVQVELRVGGRAVV